MTEFYAQISDESIVAKGNAQERNLVYCTIVHSHENMRPGSKHVTADKLSISRYNLCQLCQAEDSDSKSTKCSLRRC